jgi:hypothetical protein
MEAIRRRIQEAFERARQGDVMPNREPEIEVIPEIVASTPVNRSLFYSSKPISWSLASIHEIPDTPPVPVERLYKDALKSLGL